MNFSALVPGDAVFLDANIFIYHFAPDPVYQASCGQLLQRIENQEIEGFTSTHVLAEAAHRLLTLEARIHFGWSSGKVTQRLKQNPGVMQSLTGFRTHCPVANCYLAGLVRADSRGRQHLPAARDAHDGRSLRGSDECPRPIQTRQRRRRFRPSAGHHAACAILTSCRPISCRVAT